MDHRKLIRRKQIAGPAGRRSVQFVDSVSIMNEASSEFFGRIESITGTVSLSRGWPGGLQSQARCRRRMIEAVEKRLGRET